MLVTLCVKKLGRPLAQFFVIFTGTPLLLFIKLYMSLILPHLM